MDRLIEGLHYFGLSVNISWAQVGRAYSAPRLDMRPEPRPYLPLQRASF